MIQPDLLGDLVAALEQLCPILPSDKATSTWDRQPVVRLAVERLWITAGNLAETNRMASGIDSGVDRKTSWPATETSKILLTARHTDGRLVVSVADDGVGGAAGRNGSGLTGLSDRVAAHGSTLDIDSHNGCGTTLVGEFPCAT